METVVNARIDIGLICFAGCFQRLFVGGPSFIDARIQFAIVEQQRGFDSGDIFSLWLTAIK